MSWDSYIDNLLAQCCDSADKACIIGKDGSKWTTDGHQNALQCSAPEAAAIGKAFQSGDFSGFQANGVWIGGTKYQFLRADDNAVFAKKKDCGALSIQASKTACVIAHVKEGGQQGNTNKGVSAIATYLEGLNM